MSLLPPIYYKEIRREKIFRLSVLFLILISGVLLVGIIFIFPSYFTLMFSTEDILRRWDAEQQSFERQDITSFEETVAKINKQSALYLNNENRRYQLAPLLVRIAEADDKNIRLNKINLQPENGGSFHIVISGTAATRDALLEYTQKLKNTPEFGLIRSPIKNLLKESEVPFEMDIVVKKDAYFYVAN